MLFVTGLSRASKIGSDGDAVRVLFFDISVGFDVTFLYNGTGSATPASVSIGSVGADNVEHKGYCGLVPGEVDTFTELFAGGSASGTMCLVMPDDVTAFTLFATADFNRFTWLATS